MRNKFFYIFLTILISLLVNKNSLAEQLKIKSTEVNIQKKSELSFLAMLRQRINLIIRLKRMRQYIQNQKIY